MSSSISFEEIQQKTLKGLSPEAKVDVVRGLIKRYIRDHTEGATAPAIAQELEISHNTSKKHLEYLVATGEIYKKQYSVRNIVYFPNDRLSHPHHQSQIEIGNQLFRINMIDNVSGEYVYIQELKETPNSSIKVIGGIIINKKNLDVLINEINEILEQEEEKYD